MKEIHLSIKDLQLYMDSIQEDLNIPKASIYEFVLKRLKKYHLTQGEKFKLSLGNVDFSLEENNIKLEHANLSGVIFKNVNFNSDHIKLRKANLVGCKYINTKFTGGISLENTELGPIELDKGIFSDVQLEDAKYDPTNPREILFPITKSILEGYLTSAEPKENLNKYLNDLLGHIYDDRPLIADLSNMIIDERFSGANISGANLSNAKITGDITNLIMQDCKTNNTTFEESKLTNPDLRGTSLANKGIWLDNKFNAANFVGNVHFESPKLSLNHNLNKLNGYSLKLAEETHTYEDDVLLTEGIRITDPILDPCYNRDNHRIIKTPYKCDANDLKQYYEYNTTTIGTKEDFISFIKRTKNIQENNIYADFSEENLNDTNFSRGIFKDCDFSLTTINGCNLNHATFENCNFTCASSSLSFINSQKSIAYNIGQGIRYLASNILPKNYLENDKPVNMERANFKNCDFTWANLPNAKGQNLTFENVKAVNLTAPNLEIPNGILLNSNISGAYLFNAKAQSASIHQTDCTNTILEKSTMPNCNIAKSNLNGTNLNATNLSSAQIIEIKSDETTNWNHSKVNGTQLVASNISGSCRNMKTDNTTAFPNSDCAKLKIETAIGNPNLNDAIGSDTTHRIPLEQAKQNIQENEMTFYNKIAVGLIIGLVVASIAFPPLFSATLPVTIAAIASQVVTLGCLAAAGGMAAEFIVRNFTPLKSLYDKGPSIVRPIANFFGAKTIINAINRKNNQIIENHQNQLDIRANDRNMLVQRENNIDRLDAEARITRIAEAAKKTAKKAKSKDNLVKNNLGKKTTRTIQRT